MSGMIMQPEQPVMIMQPIVNTDMELVNPGGSSSVGVKPPDPQPELIGPPAPPHLGGGGVYVGNTSPGNDMGSVGISPEGQEMIKEMQEQQIIDQGPLEPKQAGLFDFGKYTPYVIGGVALLSIGAILFRKKLS